MREGERKKGEEERRDKEGREIEKETETNASNKQIYVVKLWIGEHSCRVY